MWQCSDFEAVEGGEFDLQGEAGSVSMRLHEVKLLQRTEVEESFSLLFTAPSADLGQGTYLVRQAELGALELFLVPVGPCADEPSMMAYESVFNIRLDQPG